MLVDKEIRKYAEKYGMISPFHESQLQPNSYDVRLSDTIKILNKSAFENEKIVDLYQCQSNIWDTVHMADSYLLMPNQCILGATVETVSLPNNICATVEGKSSLGRWFICNHITAGYIDSGFNGTITLEIKNNFNLPVKIYPNMLIGQIAFHKNKKCEKPYCGKYVGQCEPTESMYYKNKKIDVSSQLHSARGRRIAHNNLK